MPPPVVTKCIDKKKLMDRVSNHAKGVIDPSPYIATTRHHLLLEEVERCLIGATLDLRPTCDG